jgi:hypothetical protein
MGAIAPSLNSGRTRVGFRIAAPYANRVPAVLHAARSSASPGCAMVLDRSSVLSGARSRPDRAVAP